MPIPGTCKEEPYEDCVDLAKTKERTIAYPVCEDVPSQVCVEVPEQRCRDIPDKKCAQKPYEVCKVSSSLLFDKNCSLSPRTFPTKFVTKSTRRLQ